MRTSSALIVGTLLGVLTSLPGAADEADPTTVTVTAKRPHSAAAPAERIPPQVAVEIVAPLLTDMPEAEIDQHMAPIGLGR